MLLSAGGMETFLCWLHFPPPKPLKFEVSSLFLKKLTHSVEYLRLSGTRRQSKIQLINDRNFVILNQQQILNIVAVAAWCIKCFRRLINYSYKCFILLSVIHIGGCHCSYTATMLHTLNLYSCFSNIDTVFIKFILLGVTLARYPHVLHTDCTLHAMC